MKDFKNIKVDYYKSAILLFGFQMIFLVIYINNNFLQKYGLFLVEKSSATEFILGLIILVLNISSIIVVKRLYEYSVEKQEYEVNKLKFKHIEEQNSLYRQYKHDLKNHLAVLQILSRAQRYNELNDYLENYTTELNSDTISVNTGLQELDALLYLKLSQAREKSVVINFRCSTQIKCKRKHIIDITSIMSNLLDNAIEACVSSKDQLLDILIREDPLDYIFKISNTFSENIIPPKDTVFIEGFSTKGTGRGLGLAIVKKLTNRLGGSVNLEITDYRFTISIEIPKLSLEGSE